MKIEGGEEFELVVVLFLFLSQDGEKSGRRRFKSEMRMVSARPISAAALLLELVVTFGVFGRGIGYRKIGARTGRLSVWLRSYHQSVVRLRRVELLLLHVFFFFKKTKDSLEALSLLGFFGFAPLTHQFPTLCDRHPSLGQRKKNNSSFRLALVVSVNPVSANWMCVCCVCVLCVIRVCESPAPSQTPPRIRFFCFPSLFAPPQK